MSPSQENYSVPSGTEAIPYVCFAPSQESPSRVIPFSSHQRCSFMHKHFCCICSESAKPVFMGNSLNERQRGLSCRRGQHKEKREQDCVFFIFMEKEGG